MYYMLKETGSEEGIEIGIKSEEGLEMKLVVWPDI